MYLMQAQVFAGVPKEYLNKFYLLFEQRWPKFDESKSMRGVSIFISHKNCNTVNPLIDNYAKDGG